jgi:hypothetical protein
MLVLLFSLRKMLEVSNLLLRYRYPDGVELIH